MKSIVIILLILISTGAFADPGKRLAKEERKKARIERRINRVNNPWDQRSTVQRKRDYRAIIFLVLSAGLVVQATMPKE